ncbi:MAG: hypothetical protein ABI471_04445 [Sphingomonas bacterium]
MLIEDDEIAVMARVTMSLGDRCQEAIDRNLASALRDGRWDDMNKWHRVRLRIGRMERQMTRTSSIHSSGARRHTQRMMHFA